MTRWSRTRLLPILLATAARALRPQQHCTRRAPPLRAAKRPPPKQSPQALKLALSTVVVACAAPVPRTLFAWHPALATLSLPLAAAAGVAVAGRAAAAKRAAGADRRGVLEERIKLHFFLSASASWCLVLSTAAVALSKGRGPHLVSAHARAGAVALVAWFGALLAAERKVWRDGAARRLAFPAAATACP